ncbi:hypothetical protein AB0C65_26695 [Nocardia sp. NPDC048505]
MFEQLTIGGWLSTNGCSVRSLVDREENHVTFIFGTTDRDFELSVDVDTLREMLRLGGAALDAFSTHSGDRQ